MSLERVKKYLKSYRLDDKIIELNQSSATVDLAAEALGVIPARIAKSLTFKSEDNCIMVITAGDTKIDNRKFKDFFKIKAKMLTPQEVIEFTNHEIGGVCPFGINYDRVKVYCDISMKRFETVYPACGSCNSAIELTCDKLFEISQTLDWIDVCK